MQHAIPALGAILITATLLSVLLRSLRQSTILAFLLVGLGAGMLVHELHVEAELLTVFIELGIILLMYVAGLQLDVEGLVKRWRLAVTYGVSQTVLNIAAAAALGHFVIGLTGATTLVYFGLCLTLSSSTVAMAFLQSRRQGSMFHSQIIAAIMGLQNLVGVASLVVVKIWTSPDPAAVAVGLTLLKMVGVGGVLYFSSRLILRRVFRYYAHAKELLFIGSMSWALGVAAVCELIGFSPEIGAFMAGAAVSLLPYRLEVQDRVEPMRDFAVVLFFIALGLSVNLERDAAALVRPVLVTSAFVLIATPVLAAVVGYATATRSRPTFYVGITLAQVSEFSLVLTFLCIRAGVLPPSQMVLMMAAALVTIAASSYVQLHAERLYRLLQRPLSLLDRHSDKRFPAFAPGFRLESHVVVIKYNELAEAVLEHFLPTGRPVLLLDLDPEVAAHLDGRHPNLVCAGLDAYSAATRERAALDKAHVVVSCMIGALEAELGILDWLRSRPQPVPFIAATDSRADALTLYERGAAYVVQTEDLAAEELDRLLTAGESDLQGLFAAGLAHAARLREQRQAGEFRFM